MTETFRPSYSVPTVASEDAPEVQTVDGTVIVQGDVSADVTFPAVQTVDGTVAVSNLEDIVVDIDFPTTQNVAGTVNVGNFPAPVDMSALATEATVAGLLTDDQLRATPVEITGTVTASGASLAVSEALNISAHNLLSAAYSGTTALATDYMLDSLELHFTTRAERTITLTTEDGTIVYKREGDYSLNVDVPFGKKLFNGGEDLTLAITQTTGACSVSGKLVIAQGELSLSGSPTVNQGTAGAEPWLVEATDFDIRNLDNDTDSVLAFSGSPFPIRTWGQFYNWRGQRYIATTGYIQQTLNTTAEALALLQNPADSGVWMILDKAEFGSTVNTRFSRYGGGTTPLVGSPTPRTTGKTNGDTGTSAMKIYTGGNSSPQFAISGGGFVAGTLRKVATMLAYDAYQLLEIDGTVILRPGQQAYWVVDEAPGGGAGNFTTFIDFEWVEIPSANAADIVAALQAKAEF